MLLSALILGFLGSLHCLGMCGPIAFMLPLDRKNAFTKGFQLFLYHLGRIMAYSIMGLAFGWVGRGLYLFGMQQKLSIAIGAVMILLIVLPKKYSSKLVLVRPLYSAIGHIKQRLGRLLKKRTPDAFLTLGFLNGFLPCGLVYVAVLGALASGTVLWGGLYMALFGLGTVPLMTAMVYLGGWLKSPLKFRPKRLVPALVLLIGILFIIRGLGLGIPYVSPKLDVTAKQGAKIECHQP